jgi:hypothetical protein
MARRLHPDWLLIAVSNLGGATKAARKIGVSREAVATWLRDGVAKAPCGPLIKLAKSLHPGMSVDQFRLGPPKKSDAEYIDRSAAA